ncbi:CBS domain-containing protein [Isachenkonia alkalipeptolytica]|uniref:CBS domain-containing protein n=1 Tax=Isachenkonia alkalipeptolytica TaxID=2565777 RepID=A0AA43XIP5_9CLOT|nr:CBS domain-containing protein [Isachenkonia alkalipeptolytica]NBG87006.1 CBS domain-containing protein [Isachenkonia alkalipeptolytica]
MLAKDIMTKEVISVKSQDLVEDVIKILMDKNISGVPVVDDEEHVIGIVTEGDLIYRSKKLRIPTFFSILDGYVFLESTKTIEKQLKKMVAYRVEDVMTTEVITVEEDQTVEEVATIMTKEKINRVPVIKDNRLVGIISRRDIIRSYSA